MKRDVHPINKLIILHFLVAVMNMFILLNKNFVKIFSKYSNEQKESNRIEFK